MKYVSVCSGIEAATVAWHPLGWTPVLFSEIEPFPRAVLQHHHPEVPLVGDFTELIATPPDADLLVGGTPCQAFSVAGKRLSLEDYRGNLSLAFADLAVRGGYEWVVWENVPGVLSTKDNAFGCFLGRLVGSDTPLLPGGGNKWTRAGVVSGPEFTAAWRVLDAQYFGVAQRRRRVFVLARRGAGQWSVADALFPEREGVSGDTPPRRETGEGAPRPAPAGADRGRAVIVPVTARMVQALGPRDVEEGALVVDKRTGVAGEGLAPTLKTDLAHDMGPVVVGALDTECGFTKATDQTVRNGHIVPVAVPPVVMRQREGKPGGGKGPLLSEDASLTLASANDQVVFAPTYGLDMECNPCVDGVMGPLLKGSPSGGGNGPPTVFAIQNPEMEKAQNGLGISEGPMFTLESRGHDAVAPTLSASNDPSRSPQSSEVTGQVAAILASGGLRPRRLTPEECEKLQGFPVGHTLVPWKKGMAPDSLRYKALGNSMAVPVMHWIGKRLQEEP